MDDMLSGSNSLEELEKLYIEVKKLLALGKFDLHKWRSNATNFLYNLDTTTTNEPLPIEVDSSAKALGVLWNSLSDKFQFLYKTEFSTKITKRVVLSELAQLFDPLGLINPVVVLGKIFMQELWILKENWDESLPQYLSDQWQRFREELHCINQIEFSRSLIESAKIINIELHGFCDSSQRAYGCVVYAKVFYINGSISINLIGAKSRIAPLKSNSLPRLELRGAVLLVEFINKLINSMPLTFDDLYMWTDSTIVLHWLASHSSRWSTFVANRVALIQELSMNAKWNKIDTKLNPADIISRGMYPSQLQNCSLWRNGPDFLRLPFNEWPAQKLVVEFEVSPEMEERTTMISLISHAFVDVVITSKYVNTF